MLRLKVAGISSLTDARYCAGMGVEFLSILAEEHGTCSMSAQALAGIRPWIEGVRWLGEFSGTSSEKLKEMATAFELDTWIVPENFDITLLNGSGIKLIRSLNSITDITQQGEAGFQLLGETLLQLKNRPESMTRLQPGSVFLAEQVPVGEAIRLHQLFPQLIFPLRSSGEERPGWMDLGALQDYLEDLEEQLDR